MKSHDLAALLLRYPNLPVATHAKNHTYMSQTDSRSHGALRVGILESYGGQHIVIGNLSKRMINPPNWHVSEALECRLPNQWEEEPYDGLTTGDVGHYAKEQQRMRLYGDGIDRFSTGIVGELSATVDARGGPPEPQFGGKWRGRAWSEDRLIADTGRTFETFQEAMEALNLLLVKFDREVYRQ